MQPGPEPQHASDIWGEEEAMAKYLKPQDEVAENRERYRKGRKDTAVKVYTILDESRYLIVRNLPALGAHKELVMKLAIHGQIDEWRLLDQTDGGEYTDVLWVRFQSLNGAKEAKKRLDDSLFYAHPLHITYAPEYETEAETWEKLQLRRMGVTARLAEIAATGEHAPERGKRPRSRDHPHTVATLAHDIVPFAAPSYSRAGTVASATSTPAAPKDEAVAFDGTPESSSLAIKAKMRCVDAAAMPSVNTQPKTKSRRGGRVQL